MYTFELNNAKKDEMYVSGNIKKTSPVVEVFSAMVDGRELGSLKKVNSVQADKSAKYIMELNSKAAMGDVNAQCELNTLRKFVIEPVLAEEMKLLSIFGTYRALGFGETIEAETYKHVGIEAKAQAEGLDVPFGAIKKEKYQVPTQIVSGGYAVNYRQAALGDMVRENEGMEETRKMIRNKAASYVLDKVVASVKDASGVKYYYENAGLVKASVDGLLKNIRRFGKPNVIGDYSIITQFSAWAGYAEVLGSKDVIGISQKVLDEIMEYGVLGKYNGSILSELPNTYDFATRDAAGTNFKTVFPQNIGFVVPTGTDSPIRTWTRGGLTSFTGNDVTTGEIMTRFDLEVAADVARGQEYKIGIIKDTTDGLA